MPDHSPCVLWHKYKDKAGYGKVTIAGVKLQASRVAYCTHHSVSLDSIAGLLVRHTCDNPPCVNPLHLVLGTTVDNSRDMVERGRSLTGVRNPNARLTAEDAAAIKASYVPYCRINGTRALARKYGVSSPVVSAICRGKSWQAVLAIQSHVRS